MNLELNETDHHAVCPECGAWTNVNGPNTTSHRIGCRTGANWMGTPTYEQQTCPGTFGATLPEIECAGPIGSQSQGRDHRQLRQQSRVTPEDEHFYLGGHEVSLDTFARTLHPDWQRSHKIGCKTGEAWKGERLQFRTKLEQWTDDDADIGSPEWVERNSRPDPLASKRLPPDPLANQVRQFERHTVDISDPAPKYVEDELIAFEKGWRRAKWFAVGWAAGVWTTLLVWWELAK